MGRTRLPAGKTWRATARPAVLRTSSLSRSRAQAAFWAAFYSLNVMAPGAPLSSIDPNLPSKTHEIPVFSEWMEDRGFSANLVGVGSDNT